MNHGAILREAISSARGHPVASIITMVIVAGMCATVLLTAGRSVGAEQAVVRTIDSAGTRSIVVETEQGAGLTSSVIDRVSRIEGVAWAAAFGPAIDATNGWNLDGTRVPVRLAWSTDFSTISPSASASGSNDSAWASSLALEQLGMEYPAGFVETNEGSTYSVVGGFATPEYLSELEPLLIVPQQDGRSVSTSTVSVLVVLASSPELVGPVTTAVQSVIGVSDPSKITITTSEVFSELRALVQGQLGTFGRGLVVVVFVISAGLVASVLYALVLLRRKDFGRRRALGATRSLIVALLLTQTAVLSCAGALAGTLAALVALAATSDPVPDVAYILAQAVLAVTVGTMAALLPAISASRRDPISELRVP